MTDFITRNQIVFSDRSVDYQGGEASFKGLTLEGLQQLQELMFLDEGDILPSPHDLLEQALGWAGCQSDFTITFGGVAYEEKCLVSIESLKIESSEGFTSSWLIELLRFYHSQPSSDLAIEANFCWMLWG